MTIGEDHTPEAVASTLLAVLRLRDPSLAHHGQRTAEVATAIGSELGLSIDQLDLLYLGAQLHDIGKLGISESILWKPTVLSRGEWQFMRTHPEIGHRLVVDSLPREVSSVVLYHHERIDGEGYPFGVDGRTLPLAVRIVQVADALDAMTSDRPYQPAMPIETALAEIARCAGSQFDPDAVEALYRAFGHIGDPRQDEARFISGHSEPESVDLREIEEEDMAPADPFAQLGRVNLRDGRV